MSFSALHRATGATPSPITDELLQAAVDAGVTETDDLDWKAELPPARGITQSDFPKDVAAMANSGGGVIVYGVRETQKAATRRVDVGNLDESHERALRGAAVSAISPPVFGLKVHRVGDEGSRAVVVEVPRSVDGPHLVYRGEYFGAPVRNDSDTVWMRERQIEVMYRARFDERRHAAEALTALYDETSAGRDIEKRAWLVAVAHPRVPRFRARLSRDEARTVLSDAERMSLAWAGRPFFHPLENVDRANPRPGLRRWVAASTARGQDSWKETWVAIHDDGSVTVATAVGAQRYSADGYLDGWQVTARGVGGAVSDAMALTRAAAQATNNDEYDVRVGIEWAGDEPLLLLAVDGFGHLHHDESTPLRRFTPVETTLDAAAPAADYHRRVYELALDCVNQGGLSAISMLRPAEPDEDDG